MVVATSNNRFHSQSSGTGTSSRLGLSPRGLLSVDRTSHRIATHHMSFYEYQSCPSSLDNQLRDSPVSHINLLYFIDGEGGTIPTFRGFPFALRVSCYWHGAKSDSESLLISWDDATCYLLFECTDWAEGRLFAVLRVYWYRSRHRHEYAHVDVRGDIFLVFDIPRV